MSKRYFEAGENVYVVPVKMPDKPESEWDDEDITYFARSAVMQINELFEDLMKERMNS